MTYINQRRDSLMGHFRSLAHDLGKQDDWVTGIVCLSICGTAGDLAWMKSLRSASDNRDVADFVPLFIQNLEKHLGLPLTPLPPVASRPPQASAH